LLTGRLGANLVIEAFVNGPHGLFLGDPLCLSSC
jgi:hypothetical protein